jgi:uncharacterized membrane protein YsdA (DUF1294 family)
MNTASFLLMGFDKLGAKLDSGRVPEMWFFLISLAGGVIGVVVGMFAFRHKTSKRSFQVKIAIAAVLLTSVLFFSALMP